MEQVKKLLQSLMQFIVPLNKEGIHDYRFLIEVITLLLEDMDNNKGMNTQLLQGSITILKARQQKAPKDNTFAVEALVSISCLSIALQDKE